MTQKNYDEDLFQKLIFKTALITIIVSAVIMLMLWLNVSVLMLYNHTLTCVLLCTVTSVFFLGIIIIILNTGELERSKKRKAFIELLRTTTKVYSEKELVGMAGDDEFIISIAKAFEEYNHTITKKLYPVALEYDRYLLSLNSQITPHFLYNTIDSIRGEVIAKGDNDTADILAAFSDMVRKTFRSDELLRTFEEEINIVDNYFRLQKYRFGDKCVLEKNFDVNDRVLMDFKIPSLSIQPLVENAISHGIDIYSSGGKITISAGRTDDHIIISVIDNGVGMDKAALDRINAIFENSVPEHTAIKEKRGIALYNINARIKLFFGDDYGLSIISSPNRGTTIGMFLPAEGHHE